MDDAVYTAAAQTVQGAAQIVRRAHERAEAAEARVAVLTEYLARIADGYIPSSAAAGMARRALEQAEEKGEQHGQ